jgi:hypothetical protein
MPLIECPECLNQISDAAPSCPLCGHPFEPLPGPLMAHPVRTSVPPAPQTVYLKDTVMTRNRGCADLLLILVVVGAAILIGGFILMSALN